MSDITSIQIALQNLYQTQEIAPSSELDKVISDLEDKLATELNLLQKDRFLIESIERIMQDEFVTNETFSDDFIRSIIEVVRKNDSEKNNDIGKHYIRARGFLLKDSDKSNESENSTQEKFDNSEASDRYKNKTEDPLNVLFGEYGPTIIKVAGTAQSALSNILDPASSKKDKEDKNLTINDIGDLLNIIKKINK